MLELIKKALKTVFVRNFRNKITALIFAVVIWGIVSFEVLEEYSREDIALEVIPVSGGALIPNIRVEFAQGGEAVILKAKFVCSRRVAQQYLSTASKLKAVHKLESPKIGVPIWLKIERGDFNLPSDVRLVSVEPATVQVTLRQIVEKKMRVDVITRGNPADGYELLSKLAEPSEVSVKGPKEVVETRATVPTEEVVIEGRASSFTSDYSVLDRLNGTKIECPAKIRVTVSIGESKREVSINIPVLVQTPPNYKYSVTLVGAGEGNTYPVRIKGPKTLVENPDIVSKLTAFVIITPDLVPRPGVAYYRTLFLTPVSEAKEIVLAQEKQIGVEIREPAEESVRDQK